MLDSVVVHTFLRMWAFTHIVHFLRRSSSIDPSGWILMAAACAVLVAPSRSYLVAFLAIVDVLSVLAAGMYVDNHAIIMMFGNLVILVNLIQRRRLESALATIRWTTLIAYGAAAFAKLNAAFFDPVTSCTTDFIGRYTRLAADWFNVDIIAPLGFLAAMPYTIAMAELAVVPLLAVRRTRHLAVLLIIPLHLSMSVNPYGTGSTFTILVLTVAFLFMSRDAQRSVAAITSSLAGVLVASPARQGLTFVILWATLVWVRSWGRSVPWLTPTTAVPNHTLITAATLLVIGVLVVAIARSRSMSGSTLPWQPPTAHTPLIMLVVFHAMNPYLGLSTVPVFTMYSNLRTEADLHNHLIVPPAPWPTTQASLIQVISTTNPELAVLASSEERLTLHETRRRVDRWPEASLEFLLNDEPRLHTPHGRDPVLERANPLLEFFIHHRTVPIGPSMCQW